MVNFVIIFKIIFVSLCISNINSVTRFHVKLQPMETDCFQEFFVRNVVGIYLNFNNYINKLLYYITITNLNFFSIIRV